MLELLMSTGVFGVSLILACFITFVALRESRKHYVHATSTVLQEFSIRSDADGDPLIHIVGRYKGIISWILLSLGIENRIELKVTDKDWTLRQGSLAGMKTVYYPLKQVTSTICGYQRSMIALFFSILFGLISLGRSLGILPILFTSLKERGEAAREAAASGLSSVLLSVLGWMILCGIAFLIFYTSKRVSLGVDAGGGNHGIVFKRSVIENKVMDLVTAEQATALLNQLLAAAVYGVPASQIPRQGIPDSADGKTKTPWGWIAGAIYLGLIVLSVAFRWYGGGVKLNVTTAPAGAAVFVDDRFAGFTTKEASLITLPHTTREGHVFIVTMDGYEPLKQTVHVGGLSSTQDVVLQLAPKKYRVRVFTRPSGAHVAVDGVDAGVSDSQGQLVLPAVEHGSHQITISRDGFRTITQSIDVSSDRPFYGPELLDEALAAQQEAQGRQRESAAHLDRGRLFFRQGQYQQAIDECDAVLKLDPSNSAAIALKSQVEQTRKVLGQ